MKIKLAVEDDGGNTATDEISVAIQDQSEAPVCKITAPAHGDELNAFWTVYDQRRRRSRFGRNLQSSVEDQRRRDSRRDRTSLRVHRTGGHLPCRHLCYYTRSGEQPRSGRQGYGYRHARRQKRSPRLLDRRTGRRRFVRADRCHRREGYGQRRGRHDRQSRVEDQRQGRGIGRYGSVRIHAHRRAEGAGEREDLAGSNRQLRQDRYGRGNSRDSRSVPRIHRHARRARPTRPSRSANRSGSPRTAPTCRR